MKTSQLHRIYSNLTLETDAPEVERMITIVQVASDNLKKSYEGYTSALHILETSNELMKTNFEKIRQINLDTDEKIRQINLDYDREIEKLMKKWQLSDTSGA